MGIFREEGVPEGVPERGSRSETDGIGRVGTRFAGGERKSESLEFFRCIG